MVYKYTIGNLENSISSAASKHQSSESTLPFLQLDILLAIAERLERLVSAAELMGSFMERNER